MTTEKNIFETAVRNKLRFTSNRGELTVEQLWDLKLTDLDTIAIAVNKERRGLAEESFVKTSTAKTKASLDLDLRLEILVHIIGVLQAEEVKRREAALNAVERKRIREAIASKDEEEFGKLSREDLEARLKELEG